MMQQGVYLELDMDDRCATLENVEVLRGEVEVMRKREGTEVEHTTWTPSFEASYTSISSVLPPMNNQKHATH